MENAKYGRAEDEEGVELVLPGRGLGGTYGGKISLWSWTAVGTV